MTPSIRGDEDIEMIDSPASSYASAGQPSPTRYDDELDDAASSHSTTSLSTHSPASSPVRRRSSPFQSKRVSGKKAAKNSNIVSKEHARVARNARVRELKLKALSINKGRISKEPAPDHQREVLRMVYDQITPYPDEAWIAQLALHFNCRYDKIKNWFSNSRQKDASDFRALHPDDKYDLSAALRQITCEGRELRMRPSALDSCDEEEWTDQFFYEVVLINDFRMTVRKRNAEANRDAANVLLGMPSH